MTLDYEVTHDDAVRLFEYINYETPTGRRTKWVLYLLVPLLSLVVNLILSSAIRRMEPNAGMVASALFFSLCLGAVTPLWYRAIVRGKIDGWVKQSGGVGLLGRQLVSTSPAGLRVVSDAVDSTYRWTAIKGIFSAKDQLYLVLSEVVLLPIPKRAFLDAAHEASFVAEVERYISGAVPVTNPIAVAPVTTSNAPWWTGHQGIRNPPVSQNDTQRNSRQ